jgi:hypothetical protein
MRLLAVVLAFAVGSAVGCDSRKFAREFREGVEEGKASKVCRDDPAVRDGATCDACCKRANATYSGRYSDPVCNCNAP